MHKSQLSKLSKPASELRATYDPDSGKQVEFRHFKPNQHDIKWAQIVKENTKKEKRELREQMVRARKSKEGRLI